MLGHRRKEEIAAYDLPIYDMPVPWSRVSDSRHSPTSMSMSWKHDGWNPGGTRKSELNHLSSNELMDYLQVDVIADWS
jgi:hypothetical protein